ncbi:MAG TPA: hypothetical protein VHD62_15550 [Opitutaceae bacterium]|nr:hypothetical protein [Opitutaceae bacterium]
MDAAAEPVRARSAAGASRWPWALGLVAVVLWVNLPVLGFDWLMFDDDINILVNPFLGRGAASTLAWAFQNLDYMRRYLPLGWLGFDALLAIDGYNATVFHAASWLLSGLNAALAFFVFEKLARSPTNGVVDERVAASRSSFVPALAAAAALVWSLHPLRAENAGWISGLLYLGSTTCALGAVLLHLSRENSSARRARDTGCGIAASLLYLASLLVYPVFLALPALLVVRAACIAKSARRGATDEMRRTASWWLAAGFAVAMNVFARFTATDAYAPVASLGASAGGHAFLGIALTFLHYIARTIWPGHVVAFYGATDRLLPPPVAWLIAAALALAALVLLRRASTRRATLGWMLAGAISLGPFVVQSSGDFHASDRYAVLWLAVWCAAFVGAARMLDRKNQALLLAAALAALAFFMPLYRTALANWRNTATLQASIDLATAASPDPGMSFARPARAFWWLGNVPESERRLRDGLQRYPQSPRLAETRTSLEALSARWHERIGAHTEIPPLAVLHFELGRAWLDRGESRAAAAHFARALTLAPTFADAARAYREETHDTAR